MARARRCLGVLAAVVFGAGLLPAAANGQTGGALPTFCKVLEIPAAPDYKPASDPAPNTYRSSHPTAVGTIPADCDDSVKTKHPDYWPVKDATILAFPDAGAASRYLTAAYASAAPIEGFGDRAVSRFTSIPEYQLAFVRGCELVVVTSDSPSTDVERASYAAAVQRAASLIDQRLTTPAAYGLAACGPATGTATTGGPATDPFTALGEGPITAEEYERLRGLIGGAPSADATDRARRILDDVVKAANARLVKANQTVTDDQRRAVQALVWTLYLAALEGKDGKPSLPALRAVVPVSIKLAETAIGPPYDERAANALVNLTRLTIGLSAAGVFTGATTTTSHKA